MELRFLNNPLEKITIETTNLCNLKCKTCFLTGIKNKGIDFFENQNCHFNSSLFEKLIKQLKKYRNYQKITINLSGGEPFLNPEIFKILEIVEKEKIRLMLFTNGTNISEKTLARLVSNKIFCLMFSIDGIRQDHDVNRGEGNFDKTLKNIEKLQLIKKETNSFFPLLAINTVISKLNLKSFDKVLDLAKELDCDILTFSLVQWFGVSCLEKSINEFYQRFGIYEERAKLIEGLDHKFGQFNSDQVKELIRKINFLKLRLIKKKSDKMHLILFPNFKKQEAYKEWFSNNCKKIDKCLNVFKQIRINHKGDVFPGCSIAFYKLGNLKKESLKEILNGQRAKNFLEEVKNNGYFYVCQRCCRRSPQSVTL